MCAPRSRCTYASLILLLSSGAAAFGQGTVVIDRPVIDPIRPGRVTTMPLKLKYQRIYIDIVDGVAVTRVEQSFINPLRTQIEGTYVFPLPDNVAVGDFSMTVGGKTLKGEVIEKDKARRTYEDIVRRTRDPGLLEFLGKRLYQASVFPIPPGDKLDIKLSYSQTVTEHGGLGTVIHPLQSQGRTAGEIEELMVRVRISSNLPLTSVFCPSHTCEIDRPNDHEATLAYEASHVTPDRDFQMYYQRKDAQFGLNVLTYRRYGEPGYFLLRLSPRIEVHRGAILPKDIAFVVDTSGSMEGAKIAQLRRALRMCIAGLRVDDRFNIYRFSTQVQPFRDNLVPASEELKEDAGKFADQLQAVGGTNINGALLAALRDDPHDSSRPYLIVFMTDGEATVDVTNPKQILDNVRGENTANVRLHVLGVGSDVNTLLLDKLAEMNRGTRDYVVEKEELEVKMGAFVGRLNNPVLTDLKLDLSPLGTSDVYPSTLPDLFHGNDIVVLGRYGAQGWRSIRLDGQMNGEPRTLTYEDEFSASRAENDFLPRLWANRKVAYLLDQIRLHGGNRELVDEVVRLATRYGIVTPYTSALILEDERRPVAGMPVRRGAAGGMGRSMGGMRSPGGLGGRARGGEDESDAENLAALGYSGGAEPASRATGESAVDASRELMEQGVAKALRDDAYARQRFGIHQVRDKAFILADGRYIDLAWDGEKKPTPVIVFGDEYFKLLASHPELAEYFALGDRVLVVLDQTVYEVVPEPKDTPADTEKPDGP